MEKRRSDTFRHWVHGLGAGHPVIQVGGTNGPTIEMDNGLWMGRKMTAIDRVLRAKAITVD